MPNLDSDVAIAAHGYHPVPLTGVEASANTAITEGALPITGSDGQDGALPPQDLRMTRDQGSIGIPRQVMADRLARERRELRSLAGGCEQQHERCGEGKQADLHAQ
jgi:hypothetical protein